ncbi:hypothetical protein Nepgr_025768 [Nepenthes gracilis]|uniref:Bromo domain-containing protein n=1 Tax=Nepenthes gracilis TaxID=150966 RepID=A0AAD3Y1F6_NEPGR|nr:hypothetical protein Nepgr_025768 [Nepenthes gracilis]
MKRKRGHKKGKGKKQPEAGINEASINAASLNAEDYSDSDDLDNAESETGMGAEIPSLTGIDRLDKFANINPDGLIIKKSVPTVVYGRVKVKLKTSKTLESQVTSSDAPRQGDTYNSSQQVSVDKQGLVTEKMEDSANSLPEMGMAFADHVPKKAGSIKIKSSKGSGSSVTHDTNVPLPGEKAQQEELKLPYKDSRYNKQELQSSLEVIKKVMKMDAAEPFNNPVNPDELGIPDYFDVIDNPMDFGTICSNLEGGSKYMNSEDVYRDVQYVWLNCYKYNNKGDYIVDLMKRVKKNFMKYWTAAGLYSGQSRKTSGVEGSYLEDSTPSGHDKKHKKGKGFKRHKDGCLCAICIMKRRRQEREAREAQEAREARPQAGHSHLRTTDSSPAQHYKEEENARVASPHGEDSSSYMETSPDMDAEAELEDIGEDMRLEAMTPQIEIQKEVNGEYHDDGDRSGDGSEKSQRGSIVDNQSYPTSVSKMRDVSSSGGRLKGDVQKQPSVQQEGQTLSLQQQKYELLELEKKRQRAKLFERFINLENSVLLELCGTLFTDDTNTPWNGPHSLARHRKTGQVTDIHMAVASFMSSSSKFA